MMRPSERDISLYERMAAELLQVAADLRNRQNESALDSGSAGRLEAYALAINTKLTVEQA